MNLIKVNFDILNTTIVELGKEVNEVQDIRKAIKDGITLLERDWKGQGMVALKNKIDNNYDETLRKYSELIEELNLCLNIALEEFGCVEEQAKKLSLNS